MSKRRSGDKMKKIYKFGIVVLAILLVAVLVAADNGVFDDTNYNENNLYNITNVTAENFKLEADSTNHVITDNATCVIITGDTATLEIC